MPGTPDARWCRCARSSPPTSAGTPSSPTSSRPSPGTGSGPHEAPLAACGRAMLTPAPACPVDEGFDPLHPEYLRDPFAVLAGIAVDERPVFFAPSIGYYVLTRCADIEEVFRDPETYSAAAAQLPLVPLTPEATQI